jgi:hypothetical protein
MNNSCCTSSNTERIRGITYVLYASWALVAYHTSAPQTLTGVWTFPCEGSGQFSPLSPRIQDTRQKCDVQQNFRFLSNTTLLGPQMMINSRPKGERTLGFQSAQDLYAGRRTLISSYFTQLYQQHPHQSKSKTISSPLIL